MGLVVRGVALESCCGRRNVSSLPLRSSSTRSGSTECRVAPSALSTESPTWYVLSWPRLAEMMAEPLGPPARMPVSERLRLVSGASTVSTTGVVSARASPKRCEFVSLVRSVGRSAVFEATDRVARVGGAPGTRLQVIPASW